LNFLVGYKVKYLQTDLAMKLGLLLVYASLKRLTYKTDPDYGLNPECGFYWILNIPHDLHDPQFDFCESFCEHFAI